MGHAKVGILEKRNPLLIRRPSPDFQDGGAGSCPGDLQPVLGCSAVWR